jgi:hypothetical protein
MVQVINPLYGKVDSDDRAYGCSCTCSVAKDNHSDGKSWVWLPGGTSCGCACNGTADNKQANKNTASNT